MSLESLNIYLVGGAVRDKYLELPHKERDWVVVGSTEQAMLERGFKRVGKDFPVFIHPKTKEEYALARTERKKGKGYYGFECHASPDVTLEQDLMRRDITINAMAETQEGELIDPFHGLADLKNKILRHVSPAFAEDPVRILRLARFMSRFAPMGFSIAEETMALMRIMVEQGEVDALVPERVWQEMERSLKEADPTQFFWVLKECGALKRLWPELDKLWGVPQKAVYHPEIDTGVHIMMALKVGTSLTNDPVVRFAIVCHDLGKGETPPSEWPSHRGHEETGVPLVEAICKRLRIPREYRDLALLVCRYHLHCHRFDEMRPGTILKVLERIDIFRQPERLEKFLTACEADARGRKGMENNAYPQREKWIEAAQVVKSIDVHPLIEQGFTGEVLGDRLRQERIRALKRFLKNTQPENDFYENDEDE